MKRPRNAAPPAVVKNRVYRLIVAVGAFLFRVLDLRLDARGTEHLPAEGGAVLALSHFSYLDFALAEWAIWGHRKRFTRFMATSQSFDHPVAGPLMRSMGHIPVDRSAGASAYRFAVHALERGEIVGVFPETRVSRSFTLLPFKAGAARMAAKSGTPIVPCVIWGSHRVMTRTHQTRLRKSRHTPITILFGAPLRPGRDDDPVLVTQQLRQAMAELLAQAQEGYPVPAEPGAWWEPAHRGGGAPTAEQAELIDFAASTKRAARQRGTLTSESAGGPVAD